MHLVTLTYHTRISLFHVTDSTICFLGNLINVRALHLRFYCKMADVGVKRSASFITLAKLYLNTCDAITNDGSSTEMY